jgi:hypothetical protein
MANRSLRKLIHQVVALRRSRPERRRPRQARQACRLAVEELESRTLLTTLAPLSTSSPTVLQSDSAGGVSDAMVSADGNSIVFTSTAPNLVPGQVDTAVASNVFLKNLQTGTITLISHLPGQDSMGADSDAYNPRVSADGRYVVYESTADDLVAGEASPLGQSNVYLYDTLTDTTTLLSHRFGSPTTAADDSSTMSYSPGFGSGPAATRYLLFSSNATDLVAGQTSPSAQHVQNLFLYDTQTGQTRLISGAFDPSTGANSPRTGGDDNTVAADLSPDGHSIVFESFATDLVPFQGGKPNNIFLYDTSSGTTSLISGAFDPLAPGNSLTDGAGLSFQPSVSADGKVITYVSGATDLVDGQTTSDNVASNNVYAYDTSLQTTTLVSGAAGSASVTGNDNSGEPVVSSDGSTIAFISQATNLTALAPGRFDGTGNVFLYHTHTGALTLVTTAVGGSVPAAAGGVLLKNPNSLSFGDLSLKTDGSRVAYESAAADLIAGESNPQGLENVFLYDTGTGMNTLVSGSGGSSTTTGDKASQYARLSADGSRVAFLSRADDLDPKYHVADGSQDLYVFDAGTPPASGPGPFLVSTSAFQTTKPALPQSDSAGGVSDAMASADGSYIVFTSTAPNLVPGQVDTAVASNVFLDNELTGTVTLISHLPGRDTAGGDSDSYNPRVSADGRYVVYESTAGDLVPGQTGPRGQANVYLYDTTTGTTTLISHRFGSPTIAGNNDSTTSYTPGFGFGPDATRYFLFSSDATDLVASASGPSVQNLFLYDTVTGSTTLVSHDANSLLTGCNNDTEDADLTPDGGLIVFQSFATDVVAGQTGTNKDNIFVYDNRPFLDGLSNPDYGRAFLVSGVYDPAIGGNSPTEGAGSSFLPSISADGGVIAYVSDATNLVANQKTSEGFASRNVYAYDPFAATTTLVSHAAGQGSVTGGDNSDEAVVSSDGSTIAFISYADNLAPGEGTFNEANVFLYATAESTTIAPGTLTLVTAAVDGPPGAAAGGVLLNSPSSPNYGDLSLSGDGSLVTYESDAANLVAGESNPDGLNNVFLYDSVSRKNTLLSGSGGSATVTGDEFSGYARLSADGSTAAILSYADDLDPAYFVNDGGQNFYVVYVDTTTDTPSGPFLVSTSAFQATATTQVYGTSADGRYVVFTSNATDVVPGLVKDNFDQDVYVLDQETGAITLVSHLPDQPTVTGDFGCDSPAISLDGNWVVFDSTADNLVAGEPAGGDTPTDNVYLFNRLTGDVTLVSHDSSAPATGGTDDSDSPVLSADGRYVAYRSLATNLVQGFKSPAKDTDTPNVFLYDRMNGSTTLVSHDAGLPLVSGATGSFSPDISSDGRYVAYESAATDLVGGATISPTENIYLFDRTTGQSVLVSHVASSATTSGQFPSSVPVITYDGTFVAFVSFATDLVLGQHSLTPTPYTNVFLYNVATRAVSLVSGLQGSPTVTASGFSDSPTVSDGANEVAFRSDAPDLVAGQINTPGSTSNIFLFDRQTGTVTLVSHAAGSPTTTAAGDSQDEDVDGAGDLVVYQSTATDLVPGQVNPAQPVQNVFLYSVALDANGLVSGQGGSANVASDVPTFQAVISADPVVTFNAAGSLVAGAQGKTSVAYVNKLVALVLTENSVAGGSPSGSVVGSLSVDSVFAGQYLPPVYRLLVGQGNNSLFALGGTVRSQAPLITQYQAGPGGVQTYDVRVQFNIGLGNYAADLQVFSPAPVIIPPPPRYTAVLLSVRVGRRKTRLMVEVIDENTAVVVDTFLSPFQPPKCRNVTATVNAADQVVITATKRGRGVTAVHPV